MAVVATKVIVRTARIDLFGIDGEWIVSAGIIIARDDYPAIVMWNGDPFVRDESIKPGAYRQVKPYRLDIGA